MERCEILLRKEKHLMVDSPNTRHLHIEFKDHAVENKAKSLKEGRPIFDQHEIVEIKFVGDPKKVLVAPAHEKCAHDPGNGQWVTYAQLYHRHYDAFKSGQDAIGEGTPIDELPFVDTARRAELKALHIHTAEALAGLEGANLSRLGMYGRELKSKAQAYIDKAKDNAVETRLAAENTALRQELDALSAHVQALQMPQAPAAPTLSPTAPEAATSKPTIPEKGDDGALKALSKSAEGPHRRATLRMPNATGSGTVSGEQEVA
jgi:hypothetical protein